MYKTIDYRLVDCPVFHLLKNVVLGLGVLLLSSCSIFEGSDNAFEPTPLTKIDLIVKLPTTWSQPSDIIYDDSLVKLQAAIADQQIFILDRVGVLFSYDRHTGQRLWQKNYTRKNHDVTISAGLVVSAGALYFSDDKANLYAVSTTSGELIWKQTLSSVSLALVAVGRDIVVARTIDGKIYGLAKDSGKTIWVYNRKVPILTFRGNSNPVVSGDTIYVGLDSGKVVAITAKDGRVLWEATITFAKGRSDIDRMVDIDGEPVVVGDNVFAISIHGNVSAIDKATGKVNWGREISSHVGLSFDQQNIYITDEKDNVWALGQENGNIIWKQDKLKYRHLTKPLASGNYLLLADKQGYVHVLSKQSGALIGRKKMDPLGYVEPGVIKGKDIYWHSNGGQLDAFRLK